MENILAFAALVLILGSVIRYICKKKNSGVKCIGCPYAEACALKKKGENCSSEP